MAIVEYESPVEVLTETEKRARTLEAAALEIEVNGWAKCDYNGAGACVNGAIGLALGWKPPAGSFCGLPANFVSRVGNVWGRSYTRDDVADYNDAIPMKEAKIGSERATFLLRWRAEEIRDGWDA